MDITLFMWVESFERRALTAKSNFMNIWMNHFRVSGREHCQVLFSSSSCFSMQAARFVVCLGGSGH